MSGWSTLEALWTLRDADLGEADWKIWTAVVASADEHGHCHPSIALLARRARAGRSSVCRWITTAPSSPVVAHGTRLLDDHKQAVLRTLSVTIEKRPSEHGDADSNLYSMTLRVVPTGTEVVPQGTYPVPTETGGSPNQNLRVVPQRTGGSPMGDQEEDIEEDHKKRTLKGSARGASTCNRRKPEVPLPGDWQPNAKHREQASKLGLELANELESFRDHAATNDRRVRDWDAAFRSWLRKGAEFAAQRAPRRNATPPQPNTTKCPDFLRPTKPKGATA